MFFCFHVYALTNLETFTSSLRLVTANPYTTFPADTAVPIAGQNSHWMRSFQTQCNEAWSKTGFFQVPSPCSEKNPVLNPLTLFILRNHSPSFGSKHFVLVEHFISPQISIFVITSSGLISQLVWDSPSFQICHQGALNHSNYWGKVGFEFVTVFSVKSKTTKKKKNTGFESVDKTSNIVNANGEGGHVLKTVFQILS